jgi:hypothetical protein
MAGMDSLAETYRLDASLAESLNRAALAIKKESLGIESSDEADLQDMREFVLLVSGALLVSQDAQAASASPYLPQGLSEDELGVARSLAPEIQQLRSHLIQGETVGEVDRQTLDQLVELTGSATSRSFRDLTRS